MEEIKKEIISIGGYSNVIVLPKDWVKQNKNLEVGSKVKLRNMGNHIIIELSNNGHGVEVSSLVEELRKNPPTEKELMELSEKIEKVSK